jgi:hypothetical protein
MSDEANDRGIQAALIEAAAEREHVERELWAAHAAYEQCMVDVREKDQALAQMRRVQIASHAQAHGGAAALRFARDSARALVLCQESAHAQAMENLAVISRQREHATVRLTERRAGERAIEIALERRSEERARERERRSYDD